MAEIKHHNCPLFELSPTVDLKSAHANCGICLQYVLNPVLPTDKNCLKHNELISWSRKYSDWKN
jgi:hypothetical protein